MGDNERGGSDMGEGKTKKSEKGRTGVGAKVEQEEETRSLSDKENSTQIRRVLRATLVKCLRCPLCDRLCRNASTIVECLHTFCSRCLQKRLKDGRTKNVCPKCSTDLGCHPFQLVRQDRLLSAIQFKLFPEQYRDHKRHASTGLCNLKRLSTC